MPEADVDIAIIGAGPVGCALALALQDSGLRIVLVGNRPAAGDAVAAALRPLALSYASRLILERVGAWDRLPVSPIEHIHVSQAGGFGRTRLSSAELGLPALGYVSDYAEVALHLAQAVAPDRFVPRDAAPPRARLVVHAEGAPSGEAPVKDYGHSAVVAAVDCEPAAHTTAWERFTPEGPLALLPCSGRYGLVWSRHNAAAPALADMGDDEFLAGLQRAFGHRAGRFVKVGARAAMPLALRYRTAPARAGEIHIGNAAQALHPVAGQGLNLGLRDAWELAAMVRDAAPAALGEFALASRFSRARRLDARATIYMTDLLATLYVRRDPLSAALRGAALAALDIFPPARRQFARRMVYGASAW